MTQPLSAATRRALRLCRKRIDDSPTSDPTMAIVHCGSSLYAVKTAQIARQHYAPNEVRRWVRFEDGDMVAEDNPYFDRSL